MKKIFGVLAVVVLTFSVFAEGSEHEEGGHGEKEFDATSHALHHALDAHEFHFTDDLVIALPVILWTDNGLVTFMSSEFHYDENGARVKFEDSDKGSVVVSKKGMKFVKMHEKIYVLDKGATHLSHDYEGVVMGGKQLTMDFSFTKNVTTIFLIAILLLIVFLRSAKKYKGDEIKAPKGIAGWTEPVILFIRDVAKENIEGDKHKKFTPYLLTLFFFILFGNLLGLLPFLANPNVTGSVSITLLLATFTFVIQLVNSKKNYWSHILAPPGVPIALYPILVPIEIAGIFIKPAALLIRLFANMTAGHIIVVSLISIIFVKENLAWAGLSVPFALFISILEILVAFLQAYIFTMLSALFIGMAAETSHH